MDDILLFLDIVQWPASVILVVAIMVWFDRREQQLIDTVISHARERENRMLDALKKCCDD